MGFAAVSDAGVFELVAEANAGSAEARRHCDAIFAADERLAVYGALAPGEARHYMLAPFRGAWSTGFVRGRMTATPFGLSVLELDPDGDRVPVHILHAPQLKSAWQGLSLIEGTGFTRLLAAVEDADGVKAVANIYASPPGA